MKKFLSVLLILVLTLALLISCTPNENKSEEEGGDAIGKPVPHSDGGDDEERFYLVGEVTALRDCIEINVIEGEYAYGIYWVLASDETNIFDQNGNQIALDNIKIGDTVEVIYTGQVMLSYPPQIVPIEVILR